jgi:hypothetical protein
MKTLITLCVFLLGGTLCAALDLDKPIDELRLTDGTVLHHVKIMSYASSSIMAKWDEGRGTIPNAALPPELLAAVEKRQPARESPATAAARLAANQARAQEQARRRTEQAARHEAELAAKATAVRKISGQMFIATQGGTTVKLGAVSVYALTGEQKEQLEHDFNMNQAPISMPSDEKLFACWPTPAAVAAQATTDADGRYDLELPGDGNYWLYAKSERFIGHRTELYVWLVAAPTVNSPGGANLDSTNNVTYTSLFRR